MKPGSAEWLRFQAQAYADATQGRGQDAVEAEALRLEKVALEFAAERVRESGEAGTERMADYVESLIVNLRD